MLFSFSFSEIIPQSIILFQHTKSRRSKNYTGLTLVHQKQRLFISFYRGKR
jgi:hypothetical protein